MKIISWNVNGIRAIYKKNFISWFNKENPDVLCLQETKAQKEQVPEEILILNGYEKYFSSALKKGYSGVSIFSKNKPKEIKYGFGMGRFDEEGRTIIAEYEDFVLLNIYFPNGGASPQRLEYKMDFYTYFLKFVVDLVNSGKNVIFCGDVNTAHKEIDLARPRQNSDRSGFLPKERAWIDEVIQNGFVDTFRMFYPEPHQYTWWDYKTRARERNVGWRIDYFFTNENFKQNIKDAFILKDVLGSDHCPIGIEILSK